MKSKEHNMLYAIVKVLDVGVSCTSDALCKWQTTALTP